MLQEASSSSVVLSSSGRILQHLIPSAQEQTYALWDPACILHWRKRLSNSLEMVYSSSTTEFNQFHAVNNDTYNHRRYIWKHWDGNGLAIDQTNAFRLLSTRFFPCLEKNIPERASRTPFCCVTAKWHVDAWETCTHQLKTCFTYKSVNNILQRAWHGFHAYLAYSQHYTSIRLDPAP